MEEEIQSVTSSEWKLVQRRLDDLENLVTDLKLKLETLGECKWNRSNSHLETQHTNEEETETVIGLNAESNSTSPASGDTDVAGHSTTHSEQLLTSAEQDTNNTADLTSTASTRSNLDDITSVNTADNGTSVSTKSTISLSNEIGIREIEKYRRAEVKLTRCDQVEVTLTSSTSKFRIAKDKSTLIPTNMESYISSKKRPVHRQKGNGVRAERTSAPPQPSREKRFVCPFCSKRFGGKSHLTVHIRVHTGDKPFHCNTCSMKFNHKSNLKAHTRIHTGNRPFECDFCSKKFIKSSNLALHRRVHTGVKPYECGLCPMKFKERQSLIRHVRSHTGERPYVCLFCSKEFATHGYLTSHMKVHTREKPNSCPFCPKVFSQGSNLKKHLNRHRGETPQIRHDEEIL